MHSEVKQLRLGNWRDKRSDWEVPMLHIREAQYIKLFKSRSASCVGPPTIQFLGLFSVAYMLTCIMCKLCKGVMLAGGINISFTTSLFPMVYYVDVIYVVFQFLGLFSVAYMLTGIICKLCKGVILVGGINISFTTSLLPMVYAYYFDISHCVHFQDHIMILLQDVTLE